MDFMRHFRPKNYGHNSKAVNYKLVNIGFLDLFGATKSFKWVQINQINNITLINFSSETDSCNRLQVLH
jgi:hypothetical protein